MISLDSERRTRRLSVVVTAKHLAILETLCREQGFSNISEALRWWIEQAPKDEKGSPA